MDQGKPQQDETPRHGTRLVTEQRQSESGDPAASDPRAPEENSKQLLTVTEKGLWREQLPEVDTKDEKPRLAVQIPPPLPFTNFTRLYLCMMQAVNDLE